MLYTEDVVSGPARLIVVDDVDRGGPDAVEVLAVVAARCAAAATAVIATAAAPLGLAPELRLEGLNAWATSGGSWR